MNWVFFKRWTGKKSNWKSKIHKIEISKKPECSYMDNFSQTNKNSFINLIEKVFVCRQECQENFYDYLTLNLKLLYKLLYKDKILWTDSMWTFSLCIHWLQNLLKDFFWHFISETEINFLKNQLEILYCFPYFFFAYSKQFKKVFQFL